MNAERLFKTVMLDLTSKQSKLEDELERVINSEEPLAQKTEKIASFLKELSLIELSLTRFNSMIRMPEQQNNTQQNNTTNE